MNRYRCIKSVWAVAAVILCVTSGHRAFAVDFESHISSIFREHCASCHNPEKLEGDLDLSNYQGVLAGSSSGEIIDLESYDPTLSTLYLVTAHEEKPVMPPEDDKIPQVKIDLLRQWIEAGAPEKRRFTFSDDVLPILSSNCFTCHNSSDRRGDLDLETYEGVMAGSSSGRIVEAGNGSGSKLVQVLRHQAEPFMPRNADQLPEDQIAIIAAWIDSGLLENSESKPVKPANSGMSLALGEVDLGKPEGPPPMPGRLVMEPQTHAPRDGAATAIAHSPWAPLAAVGSQQQILLYSTATHELLGVLPFEEGVAESIRFSRNGRLLVVGGGYPARLGIVALYDITTGKRLATIGQDYDIALAADLDATQSLVAMGGPSRVVRVFETSSGESLYELRKHTEWVTALRFSPDGVLLATGDRNGGLYVWEAPTGGRFHELRGHQNQITSVAWRPDSNVLASSSEDGTIRLWNMTDGSQIRQWNAGTGGVLDLRYTHDGRLVSAGRNGQVKVWNGDGGAVSTPVSLGDLAISAAFTEDGARVLAASLDGTVTIHFIEGGGA